MKSIPVYLINLDADKDRHEFMDDQLSNLGISYERFPAIRGTQLPDWLKPYFLDEAGEIASRLTAGEVGCYASHLVIMKRIADDGLPALVLEDDVMIKPEFSGILTEFINADLPFDILRISMTGKKDRLVSVRAHLSGGCKAVKYLRIPMNTGAYLISPEGARKFLQWKTLRTAPVDHDLHRVWENGLNTLALSPPLVTPNAFGDSSIDAMKGHSGRWRQHRISKVLIDNARRIAHAFFTGDLQSFR